MTRAPSGIGGDIRSVAAPRPANRRGMLPLPPDMPRRRHVVGESVAPARRPVARPAAALDLSGQSAAELPRRRSVPPAPVVAPTPVQPAVPTPAALPSPAPHKSARPGTRAKTSLRRPKFWSIAQYPVIAAVALAAAANTTVGQLMVAAYGVFAVFWRQTSQLTFGLALLLLISVPLFQALGQPGIAGNAAIYVFELLVVGTIQAILELRQTA